MDLASLSRAHAALQRRRHQRRLQQAPGLAAAPAAGPAMAAAPGPGGLPKLAQGVLGTQFDVADMRQTTDQARCCPVQDRVGTCIQTSHEACRAHN